MQHGYLRQLKETYGQRMAIVEVPLLADEVKGIRGIRDMAGLLFPEVKESSGNDEREIPSGRRKLPFLFGGSVLSG